MFKLLMFPHVGSGNHGCEAIVRSTKKLFPNEEVYLFSNHPESDKNYIQDINLDIIKDTEEVQRFTPKYFKTIAQKFLLQRKDAFDRATFSPILDCIDGNSIMFSIGGDLYCYDTPEYIYRVNNYVREKGCKTVLWGCSVEPSYIDQRMKEDLEKYDLICARETITYNSLKSINPNTILTVDPAFSLPTKKTDLPFEHYIGINVSPLITQREKLPGITLDNYRELIRYILDTTEENIALIPHVVWESNDDRKVLALLKDEFCDNKRVVLVSDHDACLQKYIISKCRCFVGARTHATIAAYSSCVPTLVVGYSVKARGIARDLFGSEDHFVIPVQSLTHKTDLLDAFKYIITNETEIRKHLQSIMPDYMNRINTAIDSVNKLIKN